MQSRALASALVLSLLLVQGGAWAQTRPGDTDDRGGTPPGVSRSGSGPVDGAVIDKTRPGTPSDHAADPCEPLPNDQKLACRAKMEKPSTKGTTQPRAPAPGAPNVTR